MEVMCAFLCQMNEECISFNQLPNKECYMFRTLPYQITEGTGYKLYEVGCLSLHLIMSNYCQIIVSEGSKQSQRNGKTLSLL